MAIQIPGETFNFDLPYYTNKIGELTVMFEQEQRRRLILFGAYLELKNKYEPTPQTEPQVQLDINDSSPVEDGVYVVGEDGPIKVQDLPEDVVQLEGEQVPLKRKSRKKVSSSK